MWGSWQVSFIPISSRPCFLLTAQMPSRSFPAFQNRAALAPNSLSLRDLRAFSFTTGSVKENCLNSMLSVEQLEPPCMHGKTSTAKHRPERIYSKMAVFDSGWWLGGLQSSRDRREDTLQAPTWGQCLSTLERFAWRCYWPGKYQAQIQTSKAYRYVTFSVRSRI